MRQEQIESSNKSISGGINYLSSARKRRPSFGNTVFAPEKMLLTRMMRAIGNPPLQIVLWNGQEVSNHEGNTVAQVFIHDRGALLKLIADPELNFGEMYCGTAHRCAGESAGFS